MANKVRQEAAAIGGLAAGGTLLTFLSLMAGDGLCDGGAGGGGPAPRVDYDYTTIHAFPGFDCGPWNVIYSNNASMDITISVTPEGEVDVDGKVKYTGTDGLVHEEFLFKQTTITTEDNAFTDVQVCLKSLSLTATNCRVEWTASPARRPAP